MRLIDADALIEEYDRVHVGPPGGARKLMGDAPTIEERKKGEWIELTNTNHSYVCSVCGRMLVNVTDGKNTVTKNYPFCHCGADMRKGGGEKDGQDT